MSELAEQIVDGLNDLHGAHPGARAVHAKGILCTATFTAAPEASRLSRAAHLAGGPVRAHVRFSNGTGDPGAADTERDGRGLAVKLYLPDGTTTDVVALTLPVFFARTPEDFLAFVRARRPDPATGQPDLAAVGAFLAAHPEAQPAIEAALTAPAPASYAQLVYHGIHAFRLEDAAGRARFVRYRFEPEAGLAALSDEDAATREPGYLQAELRGRLAHGPVAFRLLAQIAAPEDPVDDPTAAWPAERETVELGRLDIAAEAFDRDRDGDVLVFDPTRVTDGIACSADPILHARSAAYRVSVTRRTAPAGSAA